MISKAKRNIIILLAAILIFSCNNPFFPERENRSGERSSRNQAYFTVTFVSDGGTPVPGNQLIARGGTIAKLPVMTKAGFGFGGWYPNGRFDTEPWDFTNDRVYSNITLFARWGTPPHTVTFYDNGARPPLENSIIMVMEGTLIPEPFPLRKHDGTGTDIGDYYGFGGWFNNPTYSGEPWNFAANPMPGNDLDLYARWDTPHCIVTFNSNDGTPAPRPQDLVSGTRVVEPLAMNKSGYGFGGWWTQNGSSTGNWGREWNFATDTVSGADFTLHAKWDTNYYTVSFNANGGSNTPATQTIAFGNTVDKPQAMTRSGMGFFGWYTDSRFTIEWDFDRNAVTGDMTLYARWETAHYTVRFITEYFEPSYMPNAANIPNQDVTHGGKVFEPPPPLEARLSDGYHFAGWYTEAEHSASPDNREWDFDTDIVDDIVTDNGILRLYARWVPVVPGMVWVRAGSFMMGDNGISGSRPAHRVTLSGFYMAIREVTLEEYRAQIPGLTGNHPNTSAWGPNLPVQNVSWYDGIAYCIALTSSSPGLTPVYTMTSIQRDSAAVSIISANVGTPSWNNTGYRLPTEAEWEYAARGGRDAPANYIYSGSNNAPDVAWYNTTTNVATVPSTHGGIQTVGILAPNSLGIYDMSGNVSEWCWDWFDPNYYSRTTGFENPRGPNDGPGVTARVRRGGAWNNAVGNVRPVIRNSDLPSNGEWVHGFRVVRGPQNPPNRY